MTNQPADHVALAIRRAGWWTGDPTSDEITAELLGALKAAGYAIVKLPDPDSVDNEDDPDFHDSYVVAQWKVAGRTIEAWSDGTVGDEYDAQDAGCARAIAGALLAAAVVVGR